MCACTFRWMRKLYWNIEAFRSTCNFDHIKTHYYWSHPHVRVSFKVSTVPLVHYMLCLPRSIRPASSPLARFRTSCRCDKPVYCGQRRDMDHVGAA